MGPGPREVVWTAAARDDLGEALEYLASESPLAAVDLYEEAMESAASLAMMSQRGRHVPEIEDRRTREIFVQRYRLLYEISAHRVAVIGFVHSARHFEAWWRQR